LELRQRNFLSFFKTELELASGGSLMPKRTSPGFRPPKNRFMDAELPLPALRMIHGPPELPGFLKTAHRFC